MASVIPLLNNIFYRRSSGGGGHPADAASQAALAVALIRMHVNPSTTRPYIYSNPTKVISHPLPCLWNSPTALYTLSNMDLSQGRQSCSNSCHSAPHLLHILLGPFSANADKLTIVRKVGLGKEKFSRLGRQCRVGKDGCLPPSARLAGKERLSELKRMFQFLLDQN